MDKQKSIPKGKIKRSGIIGATTAKAGLKKLGYLSKKPFLSEEKDKEYKEENDEKIAKMIFSALGTLKGAPLKLAQMLSLEMELLPEAYQKELTKAAYQVPPINRALIRKIIKQELGDWPENIFKSFEPVSFAAASLGQVHRAVTHDSKEVAVKVQYPGIASGVKADIDMLRTILKVTSYGRWIDGPIKEVKLRLAEELDYTNEAKNTTYFHDNLKMENIIVPEVQEELTSETVLTTSRIDGLHMNEWLNTKPAVETRNYYGQLLCDLFSNTIHQNMLIHADPNIGNFLFRDDGKLGLIDFGSVKKVEDKFIESLKAIKELINKKDFNEIILLCNKIGIYYKKNISTEEFSTLVSGFYEWVTRPIRVEQFDFSEPDYFTEIIKYIPRLYSYIDRFDSSILYFGRTAYGLYRILHRLGVKAKMKII